MSTEVFEFFGRPAVDTSEHAVELAEARHCPIIGHQCEKRLGRDNSISGVCSLKPKTSGPVICCPIRLYGDGYRVLQDVSDLAFKPGLDLVPGKEARERAISSGIPVVGVFGKRWGGELPLPRKKGGGSYYVDWILALVDETGTLQEFTAVEVQTIDTTGNYRDGIDALRASRAIVGNVSGFNWENVNKRIIPQIIYKSQVLQRETKANAGLFFVCPDRVLDKIVERVGGIEALPNYPIKAGTVTFLGYDYSDSDVHPGEFVEALPLERKRTITTSIERFQVAFNNVALSKEDAYASAIERVLGTS